MSDAVPFSCACGAFKGELSNAGQRAGTRIGCFCADCRAAELYHNQPDPAPNPVDLFQTSPEAVVITQGAEHLKLMRLGPKGLFRWYAGCCGTPFANTLAKPRLPFVGLRTCVFETPDTLGKVRARAFMPRAGKPPRTQGAGRMVIGIFHRMITSRLSGGWKQSAFFDSLSGEPVCHAKVLSKAERDALYP